VLSDYGQPRAAVTGMFADGATVITETRFRATLPRGGSYENEYCFIFELRGGLIHRVREYMDTQRGAAMFARDAAGAVAAS
jgi:ketosteroid isomerase-like protein